jgi:hypothetical protein
MLLFADDPTDKNSTVSSMMGESEPDAEDLLDALMGGDDEEEEASPETPPVGGDL